MLYRDVMVPPGREREFLERFKDGTAPLQSNGDPAGWRGSAEQLPEDSRDDLRQLEDQTEEGSRGNADALNSRIEHNFDKLLAIKAREELEEVYGVAPIVRLVSSMRYSYIVSDAHHRKSPCSCRVCSVSIQSYSPSVSHFSCRLLISGRLFLSQLQIAGSFHTPSSLINHSWSRFQSCWSSTRLCRLFTRR